MGKDANLDCVMHKTGGGNPSRNENEAESSHVNGAKKLVLVRGPFVIIFVAVTREQGDLKVGKELMQSMDVLHGCLAVDDDDEGQLKL